MTSLWMVYHFERGCTLRFLNVRRMPCCHPWHHCPPSHWLSSLLEWSPLNNLVPSFIKNTLLTLANTVLIPDNHIIPNSGNVVPTLNHSIVPTLVIIVPILVNLVPTPIDVIPTHNIQLSQRLTLILSSIALSPMLTMSCPISLLTMSPLSSKMNSRLL